jgi:hypothetical protein
MVNFHDPDVIAKDASAYTFVVILCNLAMLLGLFDSGNDQAVAHHGRPLPVSLLRNSCLFLAQYRSYRPNPGLTPSWEFFTTLEYEWNVIRGRLPYLRTIWVRMRVTRCASLWFPLPSAHFCSD